MPKREPTPYTGRKQMERSVRAAVRSIKSAARCALKSAYTAEQQMTIMQEILGAQLELGEALKLGATMGRPSPWRLIAVGEEASLLAELDQRVATEEREIVKSAVLRYATRTKAAEMLGIGRTDLYKRCRRLGVEIGEGEQ